MVHNKSSGSTVEVPKPILLDPRYLGLMVVNESNLRWKQSSCSAAGACVRSPHCRGMTLNRSLSEGMLSGSGHTQLH